jgi:uracil-DNA glycosylase
VEGNIGWIGYFLEKIDRTYQRHRHWTSLDLPKLPSIKAMPTWHPAYLLRNPAAKKDVWEDMKVVLRLLADP